MTRPAPCLRPASLRPVVRSSIQRLASSIAQVAPSRSAAGLSAGTGSGCRPANMRANVWPTYPRAWLIMTLPLDCLLYSKTNLIGIGPNLSEEERLDVQTLLDHADEFASRFLDRDELWKSWFDRFRNRTEKHGCVRTAAPSYRPSHQGP